MSKIMGVLPTSRIASFYFQAIGDFLFTISAILGAVSTLAQKRSKGLYLAFAIIALAAAVVWVIGSALGLTILDAGTLVTLMEGVGFFALGISYMKSINEKQAHTQKATIAALSSGLVARTAIRPNSVTPSGFPRVTLDSLASRDRMDHACINANCPTETRAKPKACAQTSLSKKCGKCAKYSCSGQVDRALLGSPRKDQSIA